MFTGLVESVGTVASLVALGEQARVILDVPFQSELALGDSVAVNGCCLTVAALLAEGTAFDVLMQTLRVTALGDLTEGDEVNLERAMLATARFGGHFVQGHVDGTGSIVALEEQGQDHRLEIALPPEIRRLCIDKGSLCIDGISLTIAELKESSAVFWITPHTMANTHLRSKEVGGRVNVEADLLAKYVEKLVRR